MKQCYQRQNIVGISLMLAVLIFGPTVPLLAQNQQTVQSNLPAETPAAEAVEAVLLLRICRWPATEMH